MNRFKVDLLLSESVVICCLGEEGAIWLGH